MEKKLILNAEKRSPEENVKHLRKERLIPAIVYGKKQEAISIKFDYSEFLKLYRIAGESKIVNLSVDGKSIEVLVYEVTKNPINGDFQHIDFFAITKGEKVTTEIPLVFVGIAKASMEGAIIEEQLKQIEVKVLPKDLVDSFEVDISSLENPGDSIRVADLKIDREKFEILEDENAIVVTAAQVAEEIIEDTAPVAEEVPVEGQEATAGEEEKTEE